MNEFLVIQDIVIILLVSLPIIFIFRKLNLPSLVGFLLAGMIIGPYGFKLIKSVDEIEVMAEIGVILLMFTIGLEVSFTQINRIKKFLITAGGLQFLITSAVTFLIFVFAGIPFNQSIFLGFLLALSSTVIIMKLLSDRNEIESPHGKISVSISLFQDLMIVPLFLILPILSTDKNIDTINALIKIGVAFGATAVLLFAAKYFMPPIVHQIARLRMREAFTVGIILLILGTAYITHLSGLSFAIGAFIAGLILADSDYNHQILAEILTLRDAFNSIFFVSVGLLLNIQFVIHNPLLISVITVSAFILKAFIIILIVLALKYPLRIAILCGIGLGQIGEFSFVLAQAGTKFNLIGNDLYNSFLASSIFTMILTPIIFQLEPWITRQTAKLKSRIDDEEVKYAEKLSAHVIIAGYGLNGRNLARVLRETGIKYIVIELNPDTVRQEKQNGEYIMFGDISREDILKIAGAERANVIVYAISDPLITRMSLKVVKSLNPSIYALVRTRYINEVDELIKLGADEVIPEEFETALQIFRKVLEKYHIPLNVIMQQVTLLRQESYRLLRKEAMDITAFTHLDEILAQGLTETFFVNEDCSFINKTLAEINLRAQTDATIIAIVRDGNMISNPSGKDILMAGDTIILYGTHKSVDRAIELLNGGKFE
ncbi:Kef-type K+ transport system membrane subunit [Ignavibacterium album JCM 16511]|uniref:Kef-type K+ transport system membrane subunit n=1 Tax=Ignavibacterium album (strain DSM 19864 / JCM 16511 / NBRC 101810 / Mat9-16) TaxID=945713 RepID=I0AGA1_IGNAJ|nr:cation:proton antiporter [Ignavibacterium album]AFH48008.1 Kef-type K+ transport system membrane subunit [Ignavibacterium album JCM 16511]